MLPGFHLQHAGADPIPPSGIYDPTGLVSTRIRHVVYLDAAVPDDGMSIWDLFGNTPPDPERFKDGFMQVPWVKPDTKPPHSGK